MHAGIDSARWSENGPTADERRANQHPSKVFNFLRVRDPVESGISRRVYLHSSQEVCPWNVRFARTLPADSPFKPREVLAGKDARQLSRELLTTTQEEFSAAFKGSPMKRAKLRGLKRNAAVVLGNVRTASQMEKVEDAQVLTRALDDPEPLVREHASWALRRAGLPLSGA